MEQETLGSSSTRNDDSSAGLGRLTLTPPRIIGSDSPNNPWAEIDALYRTRYPAEDPPSRSTRLRIELDEEDRQGFANRLRRPFGDLGLASRDESSIILRGVLRQHNEDDERPPETMGLCWSPDGRILYVGAENGIYEYHVNIAGRKRFPSLVLR